MLTFGNQFVGYPRQGEDVPNVVMWWMDQVEKRKGRGVPDLRERIVSPEDVILNLIGAAPSQQHRTVCVLTRIVPSPMKAAFAKVFQREGQGKIAKETHRKS